MKKVFVSSTFIDLMEHRRAVRDAILRLGMHPIAMEDFGSQPEDPKTVSRNKVQDCDAFVGIYAHRYGYVPPEDECSITEQEFDLAQQIQKPCFCYLVRSDYPWPLGLVQEEFKSKLSEFKAKVSRLVRSEFTTPDNLAWQIGTDLGRWLAETGDPEERRHLVPITVADLAKINKLLRQLKELHHLLQEITLDLDGFQSFVRQAQRASPPAGVEDLRDFWQRQCVPKLSIFRMLLEKKTVENGSRRAIEDIVQWQRNLEEALNDKYTTIDGIYGIVRTLGSKCTQHLLWADSELHEVASRSCELSDRLVILTRGGDK